MFKWNIFVSFDKSRIWILLIPPIPNYPSFIWTNQKNLFSLELWIPETNALYFYRIRNHFGKFHNNLDWSKTIWPFPKSFLAYRKTRHNLRTVNWNVFVSFDKSRIWISLILPVPSYPSLIWTNQKNAGFEIWNSQLVEPHYKRG